MSGPSSMEFRLSDYGINDRRDLSLLESCQCWIRCYDLELVCGNCFTCNIVDFVLTTFMKLGFPVFCFCPAYSDPAH